MNLPDFLEKVNTLTKNYKKNQLEWFIYNIARECPENERDSFVAKLETIESPAEAEITYQTSLLDRFEKIYNKILTYTDEEEMSEELEITAYYEYDYDSGENSIVEYDDPNNLVGFLTEAYKFILELFDNQMYEQVFKLGDEILLVSIFEDEEYSGGQAISFREFAESYLPEVDLKELARKTLISSIHAESYEEWPYTFDRVMNNSGEKVTLNELIPLGLGESPDYEKFLDALIEYLSGVYGDISGALLKEALTLKEGSLPYLINNPKIVKAHPNMVVEVLDRKDIPVEERISFGEDILKEIPEKYRIRSDIALKLARLVLGSSRKNKEDTIEEYYLESFRSETSPQNFLRAFLNTKDANHVQDILFDLIEEKKDNNRYYNTEGEYSENVISPKFYSILRFLGGNFVSAFNRVIKKEKHSYYEDYIPLLCLFLLYNDKGKDKYPKGIRYLLEQLKDEFRFSELGYSKGLSVGKPIDFYEVMRLWRSKMPDVSSFASKLLKQLHKSLVDKVGTVMANDSRGRYYECAASIAALGEVIESLDMGYTKNQYIDYYASLYPRRRNFIADLNRFSD